MPHAAQRAQLADKLAHAKSLRRFTQSRTFRRRVWEFGVRVLALSFSGCHWVAVRTRPQRAQLANKTALAHALQGKRAKACCYWGCAMKHWRTKKRKRHQARRKSSCALKSRVGRVENPISIDAKTDEPNTCRENSMKRVGISWGFRVGAGVEGTRD